jgi:hypothetical protein
VCFFAIGLSFLLLLTFTHTSIFPFFYSLKHNNDRPSGKAYSGTGLWRTGVRVLEQAYSGTGVLRMGG